MNISDKVMRRAILKASLLICATVLIGASSVSGVECKQGQSWWDARKATCVECTRCDTSKPLAVLTPCVVHRDTVCAPLHELGIDWSWLFRAQGEKRQNERNKNDEWRDENDTKLSEEVEWRFSANLEHLPSRGSVAKAPSYSNEISDYEYEFPVYDSDAYSVTELPGPRVLGHSGFAWNLQTSSLLLAVFACVVFFAVVLSYWVYHRRQWRRFKANLDTDVECVSAKLLMLAVAEAEAAADNTRHYSNVADRGGHGGGNHKLLGHNTRTTGAGNVYIQEKHKHINNLI